MEHFKKFAKLWLTTVMVCSLTLFVAIALIMGSDDIVVIGAAFIAALMFTIIPAAVYAFLTLFLTPYIKNDTLRFGMDCLLGACLLGYHPILSVVNTLLVLALKDRDVKPAIEIDEEPASEPIVIELYDNEIVGRPLYISPEQTLLSLLKDKGAPIDGIMYFRVTPGYTITFTHDSFRSCRIYHFTK